MELPDIQRRLRESILRSGIPQKEIAKAVGVSAQTVSKYIRKTVRFFGRAVGLHPRDLRLLNRGLENRAKFPWKKDDIPAHM